MFPYRCSYSIDTKTYLLQENNTMEIFAVFVMLVDFHVFSCLSFFFTKLRSLTVKELEKRDHLQYFLTYDKMAEPTRVIVFVLNV